MNGFLLDTNVVWELVKPIQDSVVIRWLGEQDERSLFLSVLTIGEIRKGIMRLPDGLHKSALENWLTSHLRLRFQGRILEVSEEIADRWGRLQAKGRELGRPLPVIDSLLMATALQHELVLVTRNTKDVSFLQIPCINPWETQKSK
jgi:hypothetical protein